MFGSNSCMNFELASPVVLTIPVCCRKGNPFQGPSMGSCLTFRNELSEETRVLTKQETSMRRGIWAKSSRVRNPGELLCHVAHSLGLYDNGVNFWVMSGRSSCLARSLTQSPSWWHVHLSAKTDSEKESGKLMFSSSFWPLLSSPSYFQWQHPVPYQDLLLLDTSGKWAWPRWVVSIYSSLTQPPSTSHGSGSNESDGEWQMKLSSLASHSPPAVQLSS